jgi:hypothetical protein
VVLFTDPRGSWRSCKTSSSLSELKQSFNPPSKDMLTPVTGLQMSHQHGIRHILGTGYAIWVQTYDRMVRSSTNACNEA